MITDCIYIHIPRTAGRSIEHVLGTDPSVSQHKTIRDFIGELTEQVVRSKFKLTCVRDPWDHAVSCWRYFHRGQMDFESWIQSGAKDFRHSLDQLDYCRTKEGEILIDCFLRFERLEGDFTPISERFNVSPKLPMFGSDEREAGMQVSLVPNEIFIITKRYRDLYTSQKSIDVVASLNRELIERFGYTF